MDFKKEAGAILDPQKNILGWFEGSSGEVEFPADLVWKLHKEKAGSVYAFSHVHPPTMVNPSSMDMELAQGWAIALYPWPVRIIVIAETEMGVYSEACFLATLEPKSLWERKALINQEKGRKITIEKEYQKYYDEKDLSWYGQFLVKKSRES